MLSIDFFANTDGMPGNGAVNRDSFTPVAQASTWLTCYDFARAHDATEATKRGKNLRALFLSNLILTLVDIAYSSSLAPLMADSIGQRNVMSTTDDQPFAQSARCLERNALRENLLQHHRADLLETTGRFGAKDRVVSLSSIFLNSSMEIFARVAGVSIDRKHRK